MVSIDNWETAAQEPTAARRDRVQLIRSGPVPSLADGFNARLETAAGLAAVLAPGGTVVLVPAKAAAKGSLGWVESCGKTQLAACVAESLGRSHKVEVLIWIVASSRASVLSGYVEAAVDVLGTDPAGDAESVATRFVNWLAETTRPWREEHNTLPPASGTGNKASPRPRHASQDQNVRPKREHRCRSNVKTFRGRLSESNR